MGLRFVLGLVVGASATIAFNKSDKIKEKVNNIFNKSKDAVNTSLQKGKETVDDVKQTIDATAECIKEKKASKKRENKNLEGI